MKHFLINLWGEIPYLLLLGACYNIVDIRMFSGQLSRLIREGWAAKLRRLFRRNIQMFPLQPADPRKILDTVAWDEGLAGHTGEVSPEHANSGDANDSFVPASETAKDDGVVPDKEYDKVFADSRVTMVPTAKDDEEWIEPVSPDECDTGGAYGGPDDDGDTDYGEMDTAFGYVVGREQTARERDLAQRTFRNLHGTLALAGLERTTERIKENIKAAVEETFADVLPKDRPLDGFKLGDYM